MLFRSERFRSLDGQDHELHESMCVIADPDRTIGLAGVMGGANTEVTDASTRVLLESAWFDPATTEIYTIAYTLSLHDALPICTRGRGLGLG